MNEDPLKQEELPEEESPAIEDPLNPQRQANEPFWAYKQRMKQVNKALRVYSRGTLVWKPKEYGTYIKSKTAK